MSATASGPDPRRARASPRVRAAREVSRLTMLDATADYNRTMLRALRAEVRTVVSGASPFLRSLLAREGMDLQHVVATLLPGEDWPFDDRHWAKMRHVVHATLRPRSLRHAMAHVAWPGSSIPPLATATVPARHVDELVVEVVEQSLEVRAKIGSTAIGTHGGVVELFVQQAFPATALAACAGRPIDEVVDLAPLNGHGWLVEAARDHSLYTDCSVFKVRTGNVRCRLGRP